MKTPRLRQAQRFLEHRFGSVDPHRMLSEKREFDSLDGGYCAIHCDLIRFKGVHSLKHVFDSVVFNLTNMEMYVTDHTGAVALRIDSDAMDGVAQNRLVKTALPGLRVDSNFVLFSQLLEDTSEGESALLAADFVDRDDLYPFQPREQIRKDPTAFCRMQSLPRSDPSEPLVVGMQRWTSMHMRKPEFEVPTSVWEQLKTNMNPWTETTQRNIAAGVQLPQQANLRLSKKIWKWT